MKKTVLALLLSAPGWLMPVYGAQAVLCGSVYSTSDASFTPGVYEVPMTSDGNFNLKGATDDRKGTGGGFASGDVYYLADINNVYSYWGNMNYYPFSMEDWTMLTGWGLSVSPYPCGMVSGMASGPGGALYGCAQDSERENFVLYSYVVNMGTTELEETAVGVIERQLGALALDKEGTLYGIDASGALYTISKTDATITKVGDTGLTPLVDGEYVPFMHASSIFGNDGKLIVSVQSADGKCRLYSVDAATAQTALLNEFAAGTVVGGLFMAEAAAEPGAPAAATELTFTGVPGMLSGVLSFKAPGTTYDGKEYSGMLNYRVLQNDVEVSSGSTYSMVDRSVDITVPQRGTYEFKVIMSNSVGDGPAAKLTTAIGYAAPAAPVVSLTTYGSSINVTWDAVTTTADGDPLDGDITYKVVRNPDGKVVEESTSWTSCWDYLSSSELTAYTYSVTAYCNGTPSEEGISDKIIGGQAQPPFTETFDEREVMDLYTIIDSNNDGYTWEFYYGEVRSATNEEMDGDDWLITPPINCQNGKYYIVSFDARVYNGDLPGKFEILVGDAPTAEAMTTVVIEPSEVVSETLTRYTGKFEATGYGSTYLGIHNITAKENWWLFGTNLTVSAPYESTVPDAATDFRAASLSTGATGVNISLKAPATDIGGNALNSIDQIELFRDGETITVVTAVTPGQLVEYFDAEAPEGSHTYTAVATNYAGEGMVATATGYSGVNLPAAVSSAAAYPTDTPGEVRIEWSPVTTFIDGTPMDPSLVTYNIYTNVTGTDMMIQTGLTGTDCTFQIMIPTEEQPQMFHQFGVTASTSGGENTKGVLTEHVGLGTPYELPYEESFSNLTMSYLSLQGGSNIYSYWDCASDNTFEEVQSQDGDNGLMAMFSQYVGSTAYFRTGLIDLGDAVTPMLTFYVFPLIGEIADTNTIDVQVGQYGVFNTIATVNLADYDTEGWHRVEVPLTEYAGKTIQINLIGTVNSYQYIHVDNLKVMQRYDNDMALTSVSVPARVKTDAVAPVSIALANYGLKKVEEFTLELLRDGEVIDSETFAGTESDARLSHTFSAPHMVSTPETVVYKVRLNFAADQNAVNNEWADMPVITIYPNYPAVNDLRATYTSEAPSTITLSWSEPEIPADYAEEMTEDFENVLPWTTDGLDGWTFVDGDNYCIYGFNFIDMPDYGPQPSSQQSWFAISDADEQLSGHFSDPAYFKAHSGSNYIGSMAVTDGEPDYLQKRTDDWAISPELSGAAQTISLWAKSMLADALEEMEILYSTGGTATTDFQVLLNVPSVPFAWTQYFVSLPAGAKHFAIRNHSRDAYVLMVDDVTYTPAGNGASALSIAGYNVYRNGERINGEPVADTAYTDASAPDGSRYTVTTVYANRGESVFSNVATPELSGINAAAATNVRIASITGAITVKGAQGMAIDVYGIDGRLVERLSGTGSDIIPTAAGVYIVRVGNQVAKVIVR